MPLAQRVPAALVAVALLSCAAVPRSTPDHRASVDALVKPLLEGRWTTGLVVGLVGPQGAEVHGYGRIAPGGPAPDGRTLFEVGSVTKTFTTLLLQLEVDEGAVRLDAPVAALLPPGTQVPGRNGKVITLEHLALHTSGLPPVPDDLVSGWDDPLAGYGAAQLHGFLARHALAADPGSGFTYSNVGSALLGHALSLRSERAWSALVAERITRPLGMADTTLTLTPAQARRFAVPHDGDLRPVPAWSFDVFDSAGGLRSTADDLLRYVAAQAGLDRTPLAGAMARTHAPRLRRDDRNELGLGWIVTDGRWVWFQGGTGGSESFVGFDRRTRTGVVVLSSTNSGFEVARQLGLALLPMVAGESTGRVDVPPARALPRAALDRCVGTFAFRASASGPELRVEIVRVGDELLARVPAGPGRFRLYAASESELYARALRGPTWLVFRGGAGSYDAVRLRHPYGPEVEARRVEAGVR